jgi:CRP/FNR family cyclic AMP-dependent transcriptional regulator
VQCVGSPGWTSGYDSVAMNRDAGRRPRREDYLAEIRTFPLFQGADEKALRELESIAVCHEYPKNNVLFHQDDPARAVFLVLRGEVKITLINEEAREVIVSLVRPGGLVGLIAILDGGPQPANAVTLSRSWLARFNGSDLLGWVDSNRAMQAALLRELAVSVRQAYQRIGEHALLSVKERLFAALLEIAEREGEPQPGREGIVFTRPTHQELADRIGSSREVVSRMLKELLDADLLEAEGKVIRVPESALVLREE